MHFQGLEPHNSTTTPIVLCTLAIIVIIIILIALIYYVNTPKVVSGSIIHTAAF